MSDRRMPAWLLSLLGAALMLLLSGCGVGDRQEAPKTDSAKARVLRIGHILPDDSHYGIGLAKFAEIVKSKSNGSLDVQIFGDAKLGDERDLIEGISLGIVEMCLTSTDALPIFSKKFMVFDLPFILQDREKFFPILDGKVGRNLLESLGSKGIQGLVYFDNGFTHMSNSKRPINKPEDLIGLKMRRMGNPIHRETFMVLGANLSPIPTGEIFSALQQKVLDGEENPLLGIKAGNFSEVQKYLTLTGHFYSPAVLMIGEKLYNELTPEQQAVLIDAAKESRNFERSFIIESEKRIIDELKSAKMEVTTPDKALFLKAAESVYKKFEAEIGKDLIDQVRGTK